MTVALSNKSNAAFVVQRGSVVNFSPPSGASLVVLGTGISIDDETSKRLVASGHCDAPPIIVLQNSPSSGEFSFRYLLLQTPGL
uniref:Uncharacterized protein n=1 Tax=Parascaris equorum TaxID=6256 RepID=A0A914RMV6_PAREQ